MRHWLLFCALIVELLASVGCRTTGAGNPPVYKIRIESGDTLASIATKYDTTWDKIARLNGLGKGKTLKVGSVIRVLPGPGGLVFSREDSGGMFSNRTRTKTPGKSASIKSESDQGAEAEFQEEDFPEVEAEDATPDGSEPTKRRRGLLFDEGARGAGLEWPVNGELSSKFGKRGRKFHSGLDIRAMRGTTVLAAGAGEVEFAGRQNGYGRVVIIRHAKLKTLYAHLNRIDVKEGDSVDHGTEVGEVGTSGNANGPHLHFEVRNLKGQALDPLSVMAQEKLISSAH